jgi:tetratricopeptide (TPR) repeat protein
MNNYQEESKLLFRLVRTKGFRFIIVKYNHYSLVEKLKEDLKARFPNRNSTEIDATKTDYRNLVDSYYELESGFFFIENFDKLLDNTEIYPALNQRRDKLAKYPIAMIAFISPSAPKLYAREIMEKMPDLWSFRSLMLELEKDIQTQEKQTQFLDTQRDVASISSLGGSTTAEKQQEMQRLEKLLADNPNDISLKEIILSQLATLHTDIGNNEKSNEIIDELLKINTDKQTEAELLINKGDNYIILGNLEKALLVFERSLKICKEIEDKTREGIALGRIGKIHQELGNLKLALDFFEKRKDLGEQLYTEFPKNVNFKNGLAVSYEKLGETNQELGNLKLALEFFEKDLELSEQLYTEFPNNVSFKNGLAVSYQFLGNTHRKLGNLKIALEFFENSNNLIEQLYTKFSNNVSFKNGLAISYEKLGETNQKLGNLKIALDFFENSNNLKEQLYNEFPNNVNFKNGLAISYEKLGQTNQELGNLQLTLDFFEKRKDLGEKLYNEFPSNVNFKNGLAISYIKLGFYFETSKDIKQAKNYYLKAKNHYVELIEEFPSYAEFQRNLQILETKLNHLQ